MAKQSRMFFLRPATPGEGGVSSSPFAQLPLPEGHLHPSPHNPAGTVCSCSHPTKQTQLVPSSLAGRNHANLFLTAMLSVRIIQPLDAEHVVIYKVHTQEPSPVIKHTYIQTHTLIPCIANAGCRWPMGVRRTHLPPNDCLNREGHKTLLIQYSGAGFFFWPPTSSRITTQRCIIKL